MDPALDKSLRRFFDNQKIEIAIGVWLSVSIRAKEKNFLRPIRINKLLNDLVKLCFCRYGNFHSHSVPSA